MKKIIVAFLFLSLLALPEVTADDDFGMSEYEAGMKAAQDALKKAGMSQELGLDAARKAIKLGNKASQQGLKSGQQGLDLGFDAARKALQGNKLGQMGLKIGEKAARDAIKLGQKATKDGLKAGAKGLDIGLKAAQDAMKLSQQALKMGLKAGKNATKGGGAAIDDAIANMKVQIRGLISKMRQLKKMNKAPGTSSAKKKELRKSFYLLRDQKKVLKEQLQEMIEVSDKLNK
ncbi:hypothetical protein ACFL35_02030 [Candidatus Riflebacteria bacterium]